MKDTTQAKWDKCLEIIRDNVSAKQFDTWFKYIGAVSCSGGTVVLSVPSMFFFEYIQEHFQDMLTLCVKKTYGPDAEIQYILEENLKDITARPEAPAQAPLTRQAGDVRPANVSPSPSQDIMPQDIDSQLNPHYTFDNYLEGESNRLARSVGESIAARPAKTFNPFFVFGHSGVGKTHLVNAIGLRVKELHPELRVLYVSAHLFMVQWTDAVRHNVRNDFITFYQTIDVLIIDDIQELSGKTDTQNTFFHIFNHLHLNGKQLILTADRPPVAITGLEERLLTRFKWGLQAEIEKPTKKLRYSILSDKVHKEGLCIPENVITYISEHIDESIRDLEGIVNSLMANSIVYDCDISMKLVNKVLPTFVEVNDQPVTVDDIKRIVCAHFGVSEDELCSRNRKRPVVYVRQMATFLANKMTDSSTIQIGRMIGGRNHATVIHSIKQIQNLLDTDEQARRDLEQLEEELQRR